MNIEISGFGWLGFWIFLSVFYYCGHIQFLAGYDNPLFTWKTSEEKELRALVIKKARREAGHE